MRNSSVFLILIFCFSCSESIVEYNTFTSQEKKYQIAYPSTWDTTSLDSQVDFTAIDQMKDSLDQYTDGFNISVYPNPTQLSLDEITTGNFRTAKELFPTAQLTKEKVVNANGIEGCSVKMVFMSGELNLTNEATFILGNGNLYTITQSAETSSLKYYKPIFKHIIDSFKLLE